MKNTTAKRRNEKHDDKGNLRRNEDWTTTTLMYDEMTYDETKTGRRHKLMKDKMIKTTMLNYDETRNTTTRRAIFHGIKRFRRHEM